MIWKQKRDSGEKEGNHLEEEVGPRVGVMFKKANENQLLVWKWQKETHYFASPNLLLSFF